MFPVDSSSDLQGIRHVSSLRVSQTEPYFVQADEAMSSDWYEMELLRWCKQAFCLAFSTLDWVVHLAVHIQYTHPDPLPNILFQYKSDLKVVVLNSILSYYTIKSF